MLLGDVTANGLPDIDSTNWKIECQDLFVNNALLQDIISNFKGQPFQLPKPIARLGNMHYRGSVVGCIDDLTLHGVFTSALGNITTNGRAFVDSTHSSMTFKGDIATRRFALGKMLDSKDLGTASLSVHVDGKASNEEPFRGSICANVDQLQFRDYEYRDVHLDGTFRNKIFKAVLRSDDPNLNLAFNGEIDLSNSQPNYDCTLLCHHLRFGELHISDKYTDSDLHFGLRLKATGKSVNNLVGTLNIDTLAFYNAGEVLRMESLELTADLHDREGAQDAIKLHSDYANASFTGSYDLTTLALTLQKMVLRYVPQAVSASTRRKLLATRTANNADFYFYFCDLAKLCSVLKLPVMLDGVPIIKGFIHESTHQMAFQTVVPDVQTVTQHFEDIALNLDNADNQLNLTASAFKHRSYSIAGDHIGDMQFFLTSHALNDSLALTFDWTNPDTIHNAGSIRFTTSFAQYAGKPLVATRIYPTNIILGDSLWQMEESRISYAVADTALLVNNFSLHSTSQFIHATGRASTQASDSIRMELQSIDLDYLLSAFTNVHNAVSFGGTATGCATAYGIIRHHF